MKKKRDYSTILEEERLILDVTEAIHQLMEEQEVNRVELARLVGVTKGRVSQLLDGKTNMTLRTLTRLLGALGHRARVETEPLDGPPHQFPPARVHDPMDGRSHCARSVTTH